MKHPLEIYADFYLFNKPGPHGLTFEDSLEFAKLDKEGRHDYFQWLFPTNIESGFNKDAPLLDEDMKAFFFKHYVAVEKIAHASSLYWNYLLTVKGWPNPTDHNNLRLSRLLRSLSLLGRVTEADIVYGLLLEIHFRDPGLTVNNMDHFRSALFDKSFFAIASPEDQKHLSGMINSLLPDHKLVFIEAEDVPDFLTLCEPVLNTEEEGPADFKTSEGIKGRGKIFHIGARNRPLLEKFFLTHRYWY